MAGSRYFWHNLVEKSPPETQRNVEQLGKESYNTKCKDPTKNNKPSMGEFRDGFAERFDALHENLLVILLYRLSHVQYF
jgi:hypothetical protein